MATQSACVKLCWRFYSAESKSDFNLYMKLLFCNINFKKRHMSCGPYPCFKLVLREHIFLSASLWWWQNIIYSWDKINYGNVSKWCQESWSITDKNRNIHGHLCHTCNTWVVFVDVLHCRTYILLHIIYNVIYV